MREDCVAEVVFIYNFLGDEFDMDLHIFIPIKFGIEIHIGDVHGQVF